MKPLYIIVIFQARPGKETELRAALLSLIPPTLKERGCMQYTYHVAPDTPSKFLSYEIWASQKDFDAHMRSPHVAALLPRVDELCKEFPRITIWDRIG